VTRTGVLEGMRYAHEKLRMDLREAKALALHITRTKGFCHRCGSVIQGSESVCAGCNSANLDW